MLISSLLAIILYLLTGALLWMRLFDKGGLSDWPKQRLLFIGLAAVVLHGWVLLQYLFTPAGVDVGIFTILSLVGWLVALLLLGAAFSQPVECLGTLVLPFTAITVLLRLVNDEHHYLSQQLPAGLEFHILFSILAYSLLSIAVVQAILLYIQDASLHNKHPGGFIRALPPMETMETLLFHMIAIGFIILSISLISGGFYLENILEQHLVHKTVLSVVAWLLFALLLWGRWQFGWRGRIAIRWVISGFIMLMLAYFGSKFVIELVLQR